MSDAFAPLHAIRSKILLAAVLLAALAGLAGWRVVLRLLQPLERLRRQVHQIRRQRLGIEALQIERRDEIGDLSRDFYSLVAEREIAEALGPTLAARGLLLVGLDVIGGRLTEVNVTSPTCFQEITQQMGFDVAAMFVDSLEAALATAP